MTVSATGSSAGKPKKPSQDFPLFPHATKRWAKKVRGKLHYFGPWSDPYAALNEWLRVKDDLLAGRRPREKTSIATMHFIGNKFLNKKRVLVDAGEMENRTWLDYQRTCKRMIRVWGKEFPVAELRPSDFTDFRVSMAKYAHVTKKNEIARVRAIFAFAYKNRLIKDPVDYGQEFDKPTQRVLRIEKKKKGKQLYDAWTIRHLIANSNSTMAAMIHLALNCGFGNKDCAMLPLQAVDLKNGWVDWHRHKTGVDRRVPLWPETVAALRDAVANRVPHKYKPNADLLFITKFGLPWFTDNTDNPVAKQFSKIARKAGVHRHGFGFYTLRHTFKTIGDRSGDRIAIESIMGHADNTIEGVYREEIEDKRLVDAVEGIRTWLFTRCRTNHQLLKVVDNAVFLAGRRSTARRAIRRNNPSTG